MSKSKNFNILTPIFQENQRAKKKVTWMVLSIIVTFAICWLPLNLLFFDMGIQYRKHEFGNRRGKPYIIFQLTAQILAYSNSCINPILYAFLSENFRKGFYK